MFNEHYMYENMTISGQSYNNKVTVEVSSESDILEFLEAVKVVAIGLTYQEGSWKRAIIELASQYEDEETLDILGL
jgi:hypothetical protein